MIPIAEPVDQVEHPNYTNSSVMKQAAMENCGISRRGWIVDCVGQFMNSLSCIHARG